LTNHQKTVTAVSVVDVTDIEGRSSSRLLSGALDGHVKVYDLDTFQVAYAFKYPAPVLAVAVAPSLASMTVGMADKTMVVRRHRNQHSTLTAVGAQLSAPLLCLC
jgi:U3 small nucleolar RNA-associated protein 15